MTQTTGRFFDEVGRLMNDAAGVAQGVRREFDTLLKTQAERMIRDLDLVKREEFEAVKDMARLAREENEALKARHRRARRRAPAEQHGPARRRRFRWRRRRHPRRPLRHRSWTSRRRRQSRPCDRQPASAAPPPVILAPGPVAAGVGGPAPDTATAGAADVGARAVHFRTSDDTPRTS